MKSYDELKAQMEAIQQQMAEAKKNKRAEALQTGCSRVRLLKGELVKS